MLAAGFAVEGQPLSVAIIRPSTWTSPVTVAVAAPSFVGPGASASVARTEAPTHSHFTTASGGSETTTDRHRWARHVAQQPLAPLVIMRADHHARMQVEPLQRSHLRLR